MPKTVILRCWSNDEFYNANFDYALVQITPELLDKIETRRKLFEETHAKDGALTALVFYDLTPAFFSAAELERAAEAHPEWVAAIDDLDGEDYGVLPNDFAPPEDWSEFYSESDRFCINDATFHWEAVPKHSSINIETYCFSYGEFAGLLAEEPVDQTKEVTCVLGPTEQA